MIQENQRLSVISFVALIILGALIWHRVSIGNIGQKNEIVESDQPFQTVYKEPDESFFENVNSTVKNVITDAGASNIVPSPSPRPKNYITAKAYLIGDIESGKIYFERRASTPLAVASMSKLVTAIIADELLPEDQIIEITSEEMKLPPDSSGITAGEKYLLDEIKYPLLLNSSNVAAEAIASTTGRVKFLEAMSSYAWEIGMPSAYFADPSGIDPHNQASARDIFGLARYLYKFRPDILDLTRTSSFVVASTTNHGEHVFTSTHPFVYDSRFLGGKTGRTTVAGETMMTLMKLSDGNKYAFVVMGSEVGARANDTRLLIKAMEDKISQ